MVFQIKQELLDEFKKIFKEEYNYEFESDQEAEEAARNLLNYFETLLKIEERHKE